MTKRIFRSIFLVAAAALLLCGALLSVVFYENYESDFTNELKQEALTISAALEAGLEPQDYLPRLGEAFRVTHISADGTVLFDNFSDASQMENHADRTEVAGALQYGAGEDERDSSTLAEKTFYYARRLADGSVLRLSGTHDSALGVFLNALKPAIAVLLLTAILAALLAYRVSRRVVKPLNALDLEHPEQIQTYDELSPLLEKIAAQNRQIAAQMQTLSKRRDEFAAVTEHMSEGLLLLDRDAHVIFANSAARVLLQIADATGQNALTINRSEAFRETARAALRGERCQQLMDLGGRVYSLVANPVLDEGERSGAVLLLLDVTERADGERLRREFTANVSHELRTPLTSISGYAELIREGLAKKEDIPRFADSICRESKRLLSLIEDILRLSRLDEGGDGVERASFSLDRVAKSVADRLRPIAEASEVTLKTDLRAATVNGVERIVDELIFNLCDNAVKYNRAGGEVLLRVREEGGRAVLTVSDNGIGIAPEEQARVFERFYRVDKSHSKAVGGTGLGLSIVKHAAAFHAAELTMDSAPGKGTSITVRFPSPER